VREPRVSNGPRGKAGVWRAITYSLQANSDGEGGGGGVRFGCPMHLDTPLYGLAGGRRVKLRPLNEPSACDAATLGRGRTVSCCHVGTNP
jgi:hypothetical protein